MPAGFAGSRNTATRVTLGATCLSSSSHLVPIENSYMVKPVALPPGRDRLSTRPLPTASGTNTKTIGTTELIALGPDVILASATPSARAVRQRIEESDRPYPRPSARRCRHCGQRPSPLPAVLAETQRRAFALPDRPRPGA